MSIISIQFHINDLYSPVVVFKKDNGDEGFLAAKCLICAIRSRQQPICHIHDLHTLVLVHFLPCASDDHLWVGVCDF